VGLATGAAAGLGRADRPPTSHHRAVTSEEASKADKTPLIPWEGMLCPMQRSALVANSPASTTAAVTEQSLPSCCVYGAPYDFSQLAVCPAKQRYIRFIW